MTNMKIVELAEIRLSQNDIDTLGPDTFALLVTLQYITNEINTMNGLFLLANSDKPKDKIAQKQQMIQRNMITRILAAKVFEAVEGVRGFRKTLERTNKSELLAILKDTLDEIDGDHQSLGYEISKELRNKATNHYSPRNVRDRLENVSENGDRTSYLHRASGDSFYPMGEEYVFIAALNRVAKDNDVTSTVALQAWLDWTFEASRRITGAFETVSLSTMLEQLGKSARVKKPYVEQHFIGGYKTKSLSLFLTEEFAEPFSRDLNSITQRDID